MTGMESSDLAPEAGFRVEQREDGRARVVAVAGEVDVHTAPLLATALEQAVAKGGSVVVDCSAVPFMDSTGLSVFVAARNQAEALGSSLGVVVSEPAVRKVFAITGLDGVIAVHETLDAALAGA